MNLLLGLFFHGLLVGLFLQGAIVDRGEGWKLFADHVGDFGADLVRTAGGGIFLDQLCGEGCGGGRRGIFFFRSLFGEQTAVAADQPYPGCCWTQSFSFSSSS
jgi:hypothetical protein